MNKTIAIELQKFAEVIAERFSHKDRKENYNNEDFKVEGYEGTFNQKLFSFIDIPFKLFD